MIKKLPMDKPLVDSYPVYGDIFSILAAHTNKYLPWAFNLFVQIFVPVDISESNRIDYAVPNVLSTCPWLETVRLERKLGLQMQNIVDLIRIYIKNNYYFYGNFNATMISTYKSNLQSYHEILIYGYNDVKKEFYFADNYKNGFYSHGVASYEEIDNATKMLEEKIDTIGFTGIKYKETSEQNHYQFDKNIYLGLLNDYVEQKASFNRWESIGNIEKYEGKKWGIGIYSYIRECLLIKRRTSDNVDRRGFYVIKEHKLILKKTMDYLLGEKWKERYPELWMYLGKDIQISTSLLNLCLKYNIVHKTDIIDKIIHYINELEKNEQNLFSRLIEIIETL